MTPLSYVWTYVTERQVALSSSKKKRNDMCDREIDGTAFIYIDMCNRETGCTVEQLEKKGIKVIENSFPNQFITSISSSMPLVKRLQCEIDDFSVLNLITLSTILCIQLILFHVQ